MNSLQGLVTYGQTVPRSTSWYLADLGEARGKQMLFTKQSPQKLAMLRQHALVESAVSSNRIEGVEVEPDRVEKLFSGKVRLRDRNEEEVKGYLEALKVIHGRRAALPVSLNTILRLHRMARADSWDAGKWKVKNSDIIETSADGRVRLRFRTVGPAKTGAFMKELIADWKTCLRDRWAHPLIAIAATNLDFLCIHPFRDGNGRVSRLLLLLQCYHLGFEAGRYISLERLIEENKERYYETLEESSRRWHEGKHDPWPYINYVLFILKSAYKEFEKRVGQLESPKGEKAEMVLEAIRRQQGNFRLLDIEHECPGVGREWIRSLLSSLRNTGAVTCRGKGPAARWRKRGSKGTTLT